MYLYLASATTASRSVPNTSSLKVALNSSTILTSSGCILVSISSDFGELHCMEEGRFHALRTQRDGNVLHEVRNGGFF